MNAAITPLAIFETINGLRIKPGVAPTSFMVCMINRLEYALNLIVLLISAKEITISTRARTERISPIFFILSLTD